MIINETIKKNAMEIYKILETMLKYERELKENYYELRDAFGVLDEATQKAFCEWMVMEELLTRLNLNDETI